MPKASLKIPKYRHHKARNLARVNINGRDIYLGEYDSPESHQKYDRLIAEWLLQRQVTPEQGQTLTICELMARYLKYALGYYVKDDKVTTEFGCITAAMKPLRKLYESQSVAEFGPKALKAVRQQMIQDGASRTYINAQIKRLQRMFKWGPSEELVPAAIYQALATVSGLRKGRTVAAERPPVPPVADSIIERILPHLPPTVADMVRLQRYCGALAKSIHLSQATVTGILSRLEKRALVSRVRSDSDRRTVVLELTDDGRAVLESAPSLLQDRFRQELLRLQEWEQTQMLATLQRIAAMMDAEEIDAAPVLAAGSTKATSEEVSRFLDKAVTPEESAATTPPDHIVNTTGLPSHADESGTEKAQISS